MATRRRTFRRGFRRRRPLTRWTAQGFNTQVNAGTNVVVTDIVVPSDYIQSATLEPTGPTLLRTLISLNVAPVTVSAGTFDYMYVGVFARDQNESSANYAVQVAQNLIDEQFIHVESFGFAFNGVGVGAPAYDGMQPWHRLFDLRSKRRLRDATVTLRLDFPSLVATENTYELQGTCRALLGGRF